MIDDVREVVAWVPIATETVAGRRPDHCDPVLAMLTAHMDLALHPWKANDRNPMPHLDWWPWIDTALAFPALARERITDAWDVLRHGLPDNEDY